MPNMSVDVSSCHQQHDFLTQHNQTSPKHFARAMDDHSSRAALLDGEEQEAERRQSYLMKSSRCLGIWKVIGRQSSLGLTSERYHL